MVKEKNMNENKMFITAQEMSELLGISLGHSYKMIRKMNKDLEEAGYLVIAGRVPKGYFEKRWFGYGESKGATI